MSNLYDLCTIVWPVLRNAHDMLDAVTNEQNCWIVGWNPHGLSVIVVAFIHDLSLSEAMQRLQAVKNDLQGYLTPQGIMGYKSLQILGRLRARRARHGLQPTSAAAALAASGRNHSSPVSPLSLSDAAEPYSPHLMQQRSDLWLELLAGPVLGGVWCCGYHIQPCQLHVIRCDPRRPYALRPTVFSACALYGPAGVRQVLAGQNPVCLPGMPSNLEGVLLPEVMHRESAPRCATEPGSRLRGDGMMSLLNWFTFALVAPTFDENSLASLSFPDYLASYSGRETAGAHSNGNGNGKGELLHGANGEQRARVGCDRAAEPTQRFFAHAWEGVSEASAAEAARTPRKPGVGVPPRLDFCTSTDFADIAATLAMCCLGANVQRALLGLDPPPSRTPPRSPSQTTGTRACPACRMPQPSPSSALARPLERIAASSWVVGCLRVLRRWGLAEGGAPGVGDENGNNSENGEGAGKGTQTRGPSNRLLNLNSFPRRGEGLPTASLAGTNLLTWQCAVLRPVLHFLMYGSLILLRWAKPFSRFSHFAEVIELRVREFVNFTALLAGESSVCGLHPVLPHQLCASADRQYFCYLNYLSRNLTDVMLGFVITVLTLQAANTQPWMQGQARYFLFDLHMSYVDWFEGWPGGLKMNDDFNAFLAFCAKLVVTLWNFVLHLSCADGDKSYAWLDYAYSSMFYASLMGVSTALAVLVDLISLITLHLDFLYHAMALLYRHSKGVLVSLFNQFRGRKRNRLRNRTDAYTFSVEQMLMATFLFTIAFFLFPTVVVYYIYFAGIRTLLWAVKEGLVVLSHLFLYTPFFQLSHWAMFRRQYMGGIVLSDPIITMTLDGPPLTQTSSVSSLSSRADGRGGKGANFPVTPLEKSFTTVEMSVEPLPLPLSSVLADFLVVLSVLGRLLWPQRVIGLLLKGTGDGWFESPIHNLIPHLLDNCVSPRCRLLRGEKIGPQG